MKKIAVIFVIACVIATLDSFGVKYDLEPDEPGYNTYAVYDALCFLLVFPIICLRYGLWVCLSPLGFTDAIWGHNEILFIWLTDPLIVVGLVGVSYGVYRLWRMTVNKFIPKKKAAIHDSHSN